MKQTKNKIKTEPEDENYSKQKNDPWKEQTKTKT